MIYKQNYILIGLLISCGYISTLQSMDTDVRMQEIEKEEEFPIQYEDDPNNPNFRRINLSLYLYLKHKKLPLTPEQKSFIEEYKEKPLPWKLDPHQNKIFASLQYKAFFCTKRTRKKGKTTWKINRFPSLPLKAKITSGPAIRQ